MLILRPTQKLAKRLHWTLTPIVESSTTLLGDWYCNYYYDFDPSTPTVCHDLSLVLADVTCTPLDNQTPIAVTQAIFSAVSPVDLPSIQ